MLLVPQHFLLMHSKVARSCDVSLINCNEVHASGGDRERILLMRLHCTLGWRHHPGDHCWLLSSFDVLSHVHNGACARYVMVSKWMPFWLATHVDPLNDWVAKSFEQWRIHTSPINIPCGLLCRFDNLRLKFTNKPSVFVGGDLAEWIKCSASDQLGDSVSLFCLSPDFSAHFSRCTTLGFQARLENSSHKCVVFFCQTTQVGWANCQNVKLIFVGKGFLVCKYWFLRNSKSLFQTRAKTFYFWQAFRQTTVLTVSLQVQLLAQKWCRWICLIVTIICEYKILGFRRFCGY